MYNPAKRSIVCFVAILTLSFISSDVLASQRRLYETFDDQEVSSPLWVEQVDVGPISPPRYQFNTGRGGSGYCFASGTVRDPYLKWDVNSTWFTQELYVSWWVRFPSYTRDGDGWWNIKMFYPHWDGVKSHIGYFIGQPDGGFTQIGDKNGNLLVNGYGPTPTGIWDGKWHRFEHYINFEKGLYKFWYDRPVGNWTDGSYLLSNYNFGTGKWTNNLYYITIGGQDSQTANVFTREIDDIEIWDGMPDSTPAPKAPVGLKIVN